MQKNKNEKSATFYYSYSINKKCEKNGKAFKILFVGIAVFAVIVVFVVFAKMKHNGTKKFSSCAYLVIVGSFDNASEAKDYSEKVEKSGGSGFVFVDDKYEVIAFAYPKLALAEMVQKNLIDSGWKAKIKRININGGNKGLTAMQKSAKSFLFYCITKLYDLAIHYDSKAINSVGVHKNLSKIGRECIQYAEKLNLDGDDIRKCLEEIELNIKNFLKESYSNNLYSSGIKYLCVKVICLCFELSGGAL